MIRVLMVAMKFPPYFAGAAVQAVHLAKELLAKGLEIQFITDNDERKSIHEVYQGVKVYRFSTFLKRDSKLKELIYIFRIFSYLLFHSKEFDVVHFHSMRGLEWMLFPICKLLGKKTILKVTLLDNDDPLAFTRRKMGGFIRWGFHFVDRFVVISSALRDNCLRAGQPAEKIQLIYNGVDTKRYSKVDRVEKMILKEKAGYGQFEKVFLSIGRIEHRKGYDLLLDAWPMISSAFKNSALLMVGPGADESNSYYVQLRNIIAERDLKNVFFVGQVQDSADYVRLSDCFLFCSRAEGFGTVLIEAMACGVPVVAMNIPGVTEDIVRDKRVGRICFSLKPDDFEKEVANLFSEYQFEGAEEAALDIQTFFGIDRIADSYIRLYSNLLGLRMPVVNKALDEAVKV